MSELKKKLKGAFDKIKDRIRDALPDLSPQPELIPIPVRGNNRPAPRPRQQNPWG